MTENAPAKQDAPDEDRMTAQAFFKLRNRELRRRIARPADPDRYRYYNVEDYREELNRRLAERQPRWIIWLTVVIAVLTVVLILIELDWLRAVVDRV